MPTDEQIVTAKSLRLLAIDSGVPSVRLTKRLLELAADPAARERWPVQLGRVERLVERRRMERSRPVAWR